MFHVVLNLWNCGKNADTTHRCSFFLFVSTFVISYYLQQWIDLSTANDWYLTIQVARGTNVLERHESTIVELCNGAGADEKAVQECVVDFIAGGYDYENNAGENNNEDGETICGNDEDTECMIDGMMNLWADELPARSTTTGITEQSVQKTAKPKPWSSRSSGSGTWVRDPKTGEMRNIDA
jgi:hypothetical protein